jgi:alkyl sulfatase BDS1-like metallo-beta-lactamase superfamily hydrolase
VRAIWENYAGWFHHRSTTELYGVPGEAVHADLVELAGGADAVAERARERLEAGDALETIHLAEVALSAAPLCVPALEAMIAAHEKLEAESENFWLTQWLRKQLAELRSALDAARKKESKS